MQELLARLKTLYPEYDIAFQPHHSVFQSQSGMGVGTAVNVDKEEEGSTVPDQNIDKPHVGLDALGSTELQSITPASSSLMSPSHQSDVKDNGGGDPEKYRTYACMPFVANAPMYGDTFSWHHDADPCSFPDDCEWVRRFGHYINHTPGKPLFVTMLVYINSQWWRNWDSETLFLDPSTDCGVFVRPKAYRIVLMDQDMTHRVSTPSAIAKRPRYSIAVKVSVTKCESLACNPIPLSSPMQLT